MKAPQLLMALYLSSMALEDKGKKWNMGFDNRTDFSGAIRQHKKNFNKRGKRKKESHNGK